MLRKLRNWMLLKLAGDSPVLINVQIRGGYVEMPQRGLAINCTVWPS
jgi:hypothetical protein